MTAFPRRNQLGKMIPAERAIYDAIGAVENMRADVRLTKAQILMQQARDLVGDVVDEDLAAAGTKCT